MTRSMLRALNFAVIAAFVFVGCDGGGAGGVSEDVGTFLGRFSGDNAGNCDGAECFTLKVAASPAAGGAVRPNGTSSYNPGTSVSIVARPASASGYAFHRWVGYGIVNEFAESTTVSMTANRTVTANFYVPFNKDLQFKDTAYSTFTDTRDQKSYRTVTIGNRRWMAENLNYVASGNSWCYEDDNFNCTRYGRLYNWHAARGACPSEWRLPDTTDWRNLMQAIGGTGAAGKKLKSRTGWHWFNETDGNGIDEYGFSALPAGNRNTYTNSNTNVITTTFHSVGRVGLWWSNTENWYDPSAYSTIYAFSRGMYHSQDNIGEGHSDKSTGISVRCVQNVQ